MVPTGRLLGLSASPIRQRIRPLPWAGVEVERRETTRRMARVVRSGMIRRRENLMVRVRETDPFDRLDALVREAAAKHDLKLDVSGWARKTYDVYVNTREVGGMDHLARIESFATVSGEIRFFDDRALPFGEELGGILETDFGVREAVLIRDKSPNA